MSTKPGYYSLFLGEKVPSVDSCQVIKVSERYEQPAVQYSIFLTPSPFLPGAILLLDIILALYVLSRFSNGSKLHI